MPPPVQPPAALPPDYLRIHEHKGLTPANQASGFFNGLVAIFVLCFGFAKNGGRKRFVQAQISYHRRRSGICVGTDEGQVEFGDAESFIATRQIPATNTTPHSAQRRVGCYLEIREGTIVL